MDLEYNEEAAEPKDRTKWVWLGVVGVFVVMLAALWFFSGPDLRGSYVRATHILVKCNFSDPNDNARAFELITELRGRIAKGERFSRLAKDYSDDPYSAARGGDLGYSKKGDFDENFENFCWSAPIGELSDVIRTVYGYHLVKVLERNLSDADKYEQELRQRVSTDDTSASSPEQPAAASQ